MAKKVGQKVIKESNTTGKEETDPLQKLKNKMNQFRLEETEAPGQEFIWFRIEEMKSVLDKVDMSTVSDTQKTILDRLKETAGTAQGTLCSWFNAEDVKDLLKIL